MDFNLFTVRQGKETSHFIPPDRMTEGILFKTCLSVCTSVHKLFPWPSSLYTGVQFSLYSSHRGCVLLGSRTFDGIDADLLATLTLGLQKIHQRYCLSQIHLGFIDPSLSRMSYRKMFFSSFFPLFLKKKYKTDIVDWLSSIRLVGTFLQLKMRLIPRGMNKTFSM